MSDRGKGTVLYTQLQYCFVCEADMPHDVVGYWNEGSQGWPDRTNDICLGCGADDDLIIEFVQISKGASDGSKPKLK